VIVEKEVIEYDKMAGQSIILTYVLACPRARGSTKLNNIEVIPHISRRAKEH